MMHLFNQYKTKLQLCAVSFLIKEVFRDYGQAEVGIPQFEAQSASCATFARAEVAKRFNKLFLAIAQVALRFKENKFFLRLIALRTEKIYNSVCIIALRTEKNLVACALLRCAL